MGGTKVQLPSLSCICTHYTVREVSCRRPGIFLTLLRFILSKKSSHELPSLAKHGARAGGAGQEKLFQVGVRLNIFLNP